MREATVSSARAKHYEIIGAPFELGSWKPGCAEAPRVLRERRLEKRLAFLGERLGFSVTDGGDVEAPPAGDPDARPKHMAETVSYCDALMARLGVCLGEGRVPIVVGGDHTVSIATASAAARSLREAHGEEARLGLLYVDAHPDIETPQVNPETDMHATSVAHLLGRGREELANLGGFAPKLRPDDVAFIGLRDVVTEEREAIRELGMLAFAFTDVERLGIVEVCRRALERVTAGTSGFVLSFDIDVIDPSEAPAVQYPEPGGLTFREVAVVMECVATSSDLVAIEMVEVNPGLETGHRTADIAVSLIWSAVGGTML
jgi:arginase